MFQRQPQQRDFLLQQEVEERIVGVMSLDRQVGAGLGAHLEGPVSSWGPDDSSVVTGRKGFPGVRSRERIGERYFRIGGELSVEVSVG